ncbi:hypothetical protein [Glaciimonas immobilis]|uniref:Uncharacterized protein n=1 Tax=Glaciimonas immobilis TaxID=728004 RepID=A0A840RU13_9BURK|nr:hypothetical protein [Glaciimonas immobilis]KAF3997647.1 hypothetical protein HAV38_13365 [Glaciimonas immobilis]MBB5200642.1 hypothetical protein [Glaciimonas immobilis]
MSTYTDQVRDYVHRYEQETGEVGLIDPHEVAAWAYRHGLIKPNTKTIIDAIASDISQVFREEHRTDSRGRRYRAKHAIKITKGNKQGSLWADIDDKNAPRSHFVRSFAERRRQVVGECVQLKTDVDVYNEKNLTSEPIQIVLDFTEDVDELLQKYEDTAEEI